MSNRLFQGVIHQMKDAIDRVIGVIDEKGQDVWSDIVLALLAKQLLEKKPGAKVIYDVKCSKALEDVVYANGGVPVMWKTGHSYIKSKLHELDAELAGERSGHIFVSGDDWYGFDDAVFVAAKLVEYLSNREETVSEIIDRTIQLPSPTPVYGILDISSGSCSMLESITRSTMCTTPFSTSLSPQIIAALLLSMM